MVDLSQLCRGHEMWLKRVDKHTWLVVWESGNLILCYYLAGHASRHLLMNAVSGNTEKKRRYFGSRGRDTPRSLYAAYMLFIRVWVFFSTIEDRPFR